MDHQVVVLDAPLEGPRVVPASKSLHQRALALAALAEGEARVEAGPGEPGDDVQRLALALETLGRWTDGALGASRERRTVDLGLGATGFRFTLALATLRPDGARTLVRGRPALLRRPHTPLRRALVGLGGHLKRRSSGAIRVRGGGVRGGNVALRADVSSQFASALLLVAPRIGGLELRLLGPQVSRPYLELTLDVLRGFGVEAVGEGLDTERGRVSVAAGIPRADTFRVEADASCAAPWWAAAALTGGEVWVPDLPRSSRQADLHLLPILERMGVHVDDGPEGTIRVRGPGGRLVAPGEVDLRDASDLLPVVGALAAAAEGVTRVVGAGHVRFKESDRLQTVAAGIRSVGGDAGVEAEDLVVRGRRLSGGTVEAAGDHRIVLAFGVLGLDVPILIRGAEAVVKSYPTFLREIDEVGGGNVGNGPPDG